MKPTRSKKAASGADEQQQTHQSASATGEPTPIRSPKRAASADSPYKESTRPERNVLATAAAGPFKTLARAIRAAGLGDELSEKGPFTIFAPTDKAFSRMPKAELDALMQDPPALTRVIMSHVVRSRVKGPRVNEPKSATSAHGSELTLTREADGFHVNDARILKTDIRASNGVLHAIDTVLGRR